MNSSNDYADLISLFKEFQEFQKSKVINGIPDYTATAMKKQRQGLNEFQNCLAAIDPNGWPISHQVDYHLVRAEMNGLEFTYRVLRPWSRNPGFYETRPFTTPFHYKPTMYESLRIPKIPLPAEGISDFQMKLQAITHGELWLDTDTILRSPGYLMGFIVGKAQLTKLLADRAMQLGDKFNLRQFMDEFLAAGVIPIALTRWEMTGFDDEINKLW